MERLSIDFESRSTVNLRKTSVYQYAEHPDTYIWCAAYAFGDEDVQLWVPGAPVPEQIAEHVLDRGEIRAWNANFERVMWWLIFSHRLGWPKPELDQFYCTMADALAMALPAALGQAAEAVSLSVEKDMQGRRLMLKMAKPRRNKSGEEIVWWDDAEHRQMLYAYCKQDVVTERAMFYRTRRLIDSERETYLLDQRMNDRGILIDVPLVEAAKKIVTAGRGEANAMILELTDAAVSSVTQYAKLKTWLHENGYDVPDTTKATIRDLLAEEGVQGPVRRVLEIWADSAKASLAKLDTMLRVRNSDDIARGLQMFHGASTGRWAGKLIQPHNFPRGEIKDIERFIPLVLAGDRAAIEEEEPALVVISELLRRMLRARPGRRLVSADFKQIEARVLAWIADQKDLVSAFARGEKIYERMASYIYGVPVDEIEDPSIERHVGKGVVLGSGYQMGWRKFQTKLHEDTGIWLEDEVAEAAIDAYREMNHMIVEFWSQIEAAAVIAVRCPGKITRAGRNGLIRFTVRGKFLWCILPSGRPLGYCQPRMEYVESKVGTRMQLCYSWLDSKTRKWVRTSTYGGRLTENVVQAMSRDLMVAGMKRTEAAGYPPVLTVHDEIVADTCNDHGSTQEFEDLMRKTPQWAASCPVEVSGWEAERYRK